MNRTLLLFPRELQARFHEERYILAPLSLSLGTVLFLPLESTSIKYGEKDDIVHISISPPPPGLIMTTEKVTNPSNQWVLSSLRK